MADLTPANLYGGDEKSLALQVDSSHLFKQLLFIHGRNAVVTLRIEGAEKAERHVLVREIQKEPATGSLLHVDFQEIDLDTPREFSVPINYKGVAKGVDLGGELQINRTEIRLKGCPLDIPEQIEVDITSLEKGGPGITYGDLPLSAKVEMLEKSQVVCVSVL